MEKIKITKAGLTADIEAGMKRKELAEKYGVPVSAINKLIGILGLKGKRAATPFPFEIVEDTVEMLPSPPETIILDEFVPVEEMMESEINN